MLFSVEDFFSKNNSLLAMVLAVFKIDITEFHFRFNAQWSILQTLLDGTINVVVFSRDSV